MSILDFTSFLKYSKTGQIFDLNKNLGKLLKDREDFFLNDNKKLK
ncbi:MAG: hypothetical protein CM1200mP33_0080 [Chloroflexota bacterium]|nr:MAG: hypothetical protein CM1200mP33_0080 [Chloroflexota bacterium]